MNKLLLEMEQKCSPWVVSVGDSSKEQEAACMVRVRVLLEIQQEAMCGRTQQTAFTGLEIQVDKLSEASLPYNVSQ